MPMFSQLINFQFKNPKDQKSRFFNLIFKMAFGEMKDWKQSIVWTKIEHCTDNSKMS